jgi:hypothetical protein
MRNQSEPIKESPRMKSSLIRSPSAARQRGQSTIDFVIYVGLAALVLGGMAYYQFTGRTQAKVNDAISGLNSMVGKTQALYSSSANGFSGISVAALIGNGAVPASMVKGTAIYSQFGTPVDVASANIYGSSDGVQFTYQAVPEGACSDFVQGAQSWFSKVQVGSSVIKSMKDGTSFNPASLGTACSATSNVTIVFVAGR